MPEEITPELFAHLVKLAALELDDGESEYLRHQLNNQLIAIHELESIPLDDSIPPARHGVPYPIEIAQPPRPDQWIPFPDPDRLLDQAPQTQDRYFVVPDIPHEKLD
jgi:aspartyl/glutamyl-tRNA(Asn/Gln) amidotransferase C subunit